MALQVEIKEAQHKESFMLGYNRGLDDPEVESDDERRILVEVPPLAPAGAGAAKPNAEEMITNPTEDTNVHIP